MTDEQTPTYEDLKQRLANAEGALQALRAGQVDTIAGDQGNLVVRLAQAEAQADHIKKVLRAIRNVGKLIVSEDDPLKMIERACVNLTETMGYLNAWIVLLDNTGEKITSTASSGFDGEFTMLEECFKRAEFTVCIKRALECDGIVVMRNPAIDCTGCSLAGEYGSRAVFSRCLRHSGKIYGILSVSVPAAYSFDEEEQSLFDDVADDLAFALNKIETSDQLRESQVLRQKAEETIRAHDSYLQTILQTSADGFWVIDANEKLIEVNGAYCVMSGYTRDEILGMRISDIEALENSSETAARVQRIITNGYELFETSHRRKDGSFFSVEVSVTWQNENGGRFICFCRDLTERKIADRKLKESEEKVRAKLEAILSPTGDIGTLELSDIIDTQAIQAIMDDFYSLTHMGAMAMLELNGKVLVAAGWQDICTKFHRIHPETSQNCLESDTQLSLGVQPGTYKSYRCKNNMWDISTPIIVGEKQMGNLFLGQFLYEEETPDYEIFRAQARLYGFDEQEYLDALNRVPRWSHETIERGMSFFSRLGTLISTMSYSNLKLARALHDRKRAEESLRKREKQLQKIFEILPIGLWFADKDGTLLRGNPMGVKIWGVGPPISMSEFGIFKAWHLPSREPVAPDEWALIKTIGHGVTIVDELLEIEAFDGKRKTILNYTAPVLDDNGNIDGAIVVNLDISDRMNLEEQLRQSQKMESVGRLAGGVAHDFNNMLGVILGHTELAMDSIPPDDPLSEDLKEIFNAAIRSADITRQLLAFARKQTISPRVIDLNSTIEGMLKMLRRLIGEDIDLAWLPGTAIWPLKMDPSQLDQILANLCVNARDAIGGVGRLTIETGKVTFDKDYCADHVECTQGDFVLLAVSDNGCGMDKQTLDNLFEPFFTTKTLGKGTGLGLATVYGIVKQNQGFINVYSEPAKGSTFRIYLPAHKVGMPEEGSRQTTPNPRARKTETILLVEDEPAILNMTTIILERLGYIVLSTHSPGEAIDLAREYGREIQLLMTDVVMPEMNGRDLAQNLLSVYPNIKRLFMSGYTADVIAHHGVLDEGVQFIQKPFSKKDLANKVRQMLDEQ